MLSNAIPATLAAPAPQSAPEGAIPAAGAALPPFPSAFAKQQCLASAGAFGIGVLSAIVTILELGQRPVPGVLDHARAAIAEWERTNAREVSP